jgi:hypothetical protein
MHFFFSLPFFSCLVHGGQTNKTRHRIIIVYDTLTNEEKAGRRKRLEGFLVALLVCLSDATTDHVHSQLDATWGLTWGQSQTDPEETGSDPSSILICALCLVQSNEIYTYISVIYTPYARLHRYHIDLYTNIIKHYVMGCCPWIPDPHVYM